MLHAPGGAPLERVSMRKNAPGTLPVTVSVRITEEEAEKIDQEVRRRSQAAGVPVRRSDVVRALVARGLSEGDQVAA
jgi:hypothetical protein